MPPPGIGDTRVGHVADVDRLERHRTRIPTRKRLQRVEQRGEPRDVALELGEHA